MLEFILFLGFAFALIPVGYLIYKYLQGEPIFESKPKKKSDYVKFLENLTSTHEPRIVAPRVSLGYILVFEFVFPDVKIKLEHNNVRYKWDIETWSKEAEKHLFYYDVLDRRPVDAINFMIDKYNLVEIANEMKNKISEKKKKEAEIEKSVLEKYGVNSQKEE